MQPTWTVLRTFGYSPKESEFLCLVTAHSGYFLRRHYYTYHRGGNGRPATLFVSKLLANQHAASHTFRRRTAVYHVYARPLYAALGREHVRLRKEHRPDYIKTKLLALEFVIQNKGYTYLVSEKERLDYFTGLGIDPQVLPTTIYKGWNHRVPTTRYFGDQFPLLLKPSEEARSRIAFTFIDPGFSTLASFISHVKKYHPLFSKLRDFSLTYIADRPTHFDRARRHFLDYVSRGPEGPQSLDEYSYPELLRFFELKS